MRKPLTYLTAIVMALLLVTAGCGSTTTSDDDGSSSDSATGGFGQYVFSTDAPDVETGLPSGTIIEGIVHLEETSYSTDLIERTTEFLQAHTDVADPYFARVEITSVEGDGPATLGSLPFTVIADGQRIEGWWGPGTPILLVTERGTETEGGSDLIREWQEQQHEFEPGFTGDAALMFDEPLTQIDEVELHPDTLEKR